MADGFEALLRRMNSLTHDQLQKANREALKQAGLVIKEAIVDRAPVLRDDERGGTSLEPGALKGDIKVGVHVAQEATDTNRVRVGPGRRTRHVAEWVENGHANAKGRGAKQRKLGTNTPAHPFVRPAADAVESLARAVYGNVMSEEIAKVMDGQPD